MKTQKEILKYKQDLSRRFNELENAIDNEQISESQAIRLRKNYNIQLHLLRWVLGKDDLSDLLLKEVE